MNSDQHPKAYGYNPYARPSFNRPAPAFNRPPPRVPDNVLHAGNLEVERKSFNITLRENDKGRFLRITEMKGTLRQSIIVPASGLKEFQQVLAEMVKEMPTPPPANPEQPA